VNGRPARRRRGGVRGSVQLRSPPRRPQNRQLLPPAGRTGRGLGWHIVVYFEAADLAERWDLFTALPTSSSFDHMAGPSHTAGGRGSEFGLFLPADGRSSEHVWFQGHRPERLTVSGPPYDDVVPFADASSRQFPDRVLWAPTGPHPNLKRHMPDDGRLVDFIPE